MHEPEGVALEEGWITGPALQTVIALKGMQKGDRVRCSACKSEHVFGRYTSPDRAYEGAPDFYVMDSGEDIGGMANEDVTAWKPTTKKVG